MLAGNHELRVCKHRVGGGMRVVLAQPTQRLVVAVLPLIQKVLGLFPVVPTEYSIRALD
jgi:hypothetical protein